MARCPSGAASPTAALHARRACYEQICFRKGRAWILLWFRQGNPAQQRPQLVRPHGWIIGRLVLGQ